MGKSLINLYTVMSDSVSRWQNLPAEPTLDLLGINSLFMSPFGFRFTYMDGSNHSSGFDFWRCRPGNAIAIDSDGNFLVFITGME